MLRMAGQLPRVVSDGRTGKDFIKSLMEKGFGIGNAARQILLSPQFVATKRKKYNHLWTSQNPWGAFEKSEATNIEVAALLRERLDDLHLQELGVDVLLVAHRPVVLEDGYPYILGLCRDGGGRRLVGFSHGFQPGPSISGIPEKRGYAYIL